MWLPKPLYESIPFNYLILGVAAIVAAFYVEAGYWPEIFAVGGILLVVTGIVLLLRRKGYRSSRSRLDFDRKP
jgi:protein-S-isoprenylcysteine O-methyltransferase Ste14